MEMQRRRLPSSVRIGQILDAALLEFSASGYAGARMDAIAQRAGLSKGGVYAHFSSKEEMFEALLVRHLHPAPLDVDALLDGAATRQELAERIVSHLYASLARPDIACMLRLLLAESGRVPHLAARWRRAAADAQQRDVSRLIEGARRRGLCGNGVVAAHPWLLLSPLVHALVMTMLGEPERVNLPARQRAHVALVSEMLSAD
ncbi:MULTISPECIES: TetR/AcrR family transcriptional regulator [unclassified Achromobacter]|uniref:TetR/AcrR family transcriptional regulator n=1 Tax=unclassified Achromobacter TaxID=2626865 RepID=UPI00069DAB5D|nr:MULTISPECIES: TetR/AcrR family transcriptional regulator [unclassified Achromobacter]KOF53739.1 TetR family transcriptional regulator [Achromobacter sp. DMS1]